MSSVAMSAVGMGRHRAVLSGIFFSTLHYLTLRHIGEGWGERGGFAGFGDPIREVASERDHVEVHPGVWCEAAPASSVSPHLFLKAVQLLADRGELPGTPAAGAKDRGRLVLTGRSGPGRP